jgi:hypothetical protein
MVFTALAEEIFEEGFPITVGRKRKCVTDERMVFIS